MHHTQTERQALDAAINRSTRRKPRKASTALPYPDLPASALVPKSIFWLACWMRHQKELEELAAHELHLLSRGKLTDPLRHALYRADDVVRDRAIDALEYCVRFGGLLFAWHGTTALDNLTAAQ